MPFSFFMPYILEESPALKLVTNGTIFAKIYHKIPINYVEVILNIK